MSYLHQLPDDPLFMEPLRVATLLRPDAIEEFLQQAFLAESPLLPTPDRLALVLLVVAPILALDPRDAARWRRSALRVVETELPQVMSLNDRRVLLQAALDFATGNPAAGAVGEIERIVTASLPLLTTPVVVPPLGDIYEEAPPVPVAAPPTPTPTPGTLAP